MAMKIFLTGLLLPYVCLTLTGLVNSHGGSHIRTALIVTDVQGCFLQGGALAVANADDVIPVINEIRRKYDDLLSLVVFTQDWHCVDHVSFASQHEGYAPFSSISLSYNGGGDLCASPGTTGHTVPCEDSEIAHILAQVLWPDHCVKDTDGAKIDQRVTSRDTDIIMRKGNRCHIDSYSTFYDNGGFAMTALDGILKSHNISTVLVTGIATDFCVYYSAIDAVKLGYDTYMIEDATKGISAGGITAAIADMKLKGVHVINSEDLASILNADDDQ